MKKFHKMFQLIMGAIGFLYPVVLFYFFPDSGSALRLYPVVVSSIFLIIFVHSLFFPPTIAERVAKIRHPNLPPEGVQYCRRVTFIWCLFFILNGSIALYTALFTSIEIWALYNGALSYVLMGALAVSEYVVRLRFLKRMALLALLVCFGVAHARAEDPLFASVVETLGQYKIFRSKFTQEKHISALRNPLHSEGQFLFDSEKGIVWSFEVPRPYSFTATRDGIIKRDPKQASVSISASDRPEIKIFTDIFLSLFKGDLNTLSEHFQIETSGNKQKWMVSLKGKQESIGRYLEHISLSGDQTLSAVSIKETNGDVTDILFTKVTTSQGALTVAEEQLFQ